MFFGVAKCLVHEAGAALGRAGRQEVTVALLAGDATARCASHWIALLACIAQLIFSSRSVWPAMPLRAHACVLMCSISGTAK